MTEYNSLEQGSTALPLERVRSRIGAYIYGDILVLAAVVAATPTGIAHWSGLVSVIAVTTTTFLAHAIAEGFSHQIGRSGRDAALHVADELRDSVPILSAGAAPAVFMLLGALGAVNPTVAESLAAATVVLRLALTGAVVRRLTGGKSRSGFLWSGLVLAALGIGVVALKLALKL